MGIIKKLPLADVLKIAAGEVVERPWNVLKELVENSLDAQATQITITVKAGGLEYIGVSDNGVGMLPEDACVCFEHHATSKITSCEDVSRISTFGFRGEALSSIAAVSQVTLITQTHDSLQGTRVEIAYGAAPVVSTCAAAPGTHMQIEHLFSQVPARKKFLKSAATEWRACVQFIHAWACARPDVGMTVYHDGQLLYSLPAGQELMHRWGQLCGPADQHHALALDKKEGDMHVRGYITSHEVHRYDRSGMIILVNGRWVKNPKLITAVLRAYKGVLPPERFPSALLLLTIPLDQVDINVHPRKEEVAFLHARTVEALIYSAVLEALQRDVSARLLPLQQSPPVLHGSPAPPAEYRGAQLLEMTMPHMSDQKKKNGYDHLPSSFLSISHPIVRVNEVQDSVVPVQSVQTITPMIMGQLLMTYIVAQMPDGMLLLDQHAAHEAILYERFKKLHHPVSVPLIFPEVLNLHDEDIRILVAHQDIFEQQGISLSPGGPGVLHITHTPVHLTMVPIGELVKQALVWLKEENSSGERLSHAVMHKWYAMVSCKAAVKAGDSLTKDQMAAIVTDLYTTEQRITCPHGRPTSWYIGQSEIERMFKRRL